MELWYVVPFRYKCVPVIAFLFCVFTVQIIEHTVDAHESQSLVTKSRLKQMGNGKEAWESEETGLYIFYKQNDGLEQVYRYTINANPKKPMNSYQVTLRSGSATVVNVKATVVSWDGVWKFWVGIGIIVITTVFQVITCVKVAKKKEK